MNLKKTAWAKQAFVAGFIVLTSLCWCPWAYGTVTGRTFAIPTWAVWAYVCAAALFALEWLFLFMTDLSVSDEELAGIISALEAVDVAPDEEGQ